MNGDLVSLRLLLVAAAPPQQDLWREGAAQASVPIDFEAHDTAAAKAALRSGGVDICVLDAELTDADKASVIKAASAKKPEPLIFVSAQSGSARPDNTDGVLPVPTNAGGVVGACAATRSGHKDQRRRFLRTRGLDHGCLVGIGQFGIQHANIHSAAAQRGFGGSGIVRLEIDRNRGLRRALTP